MFPKERETETKTQKAEQLDFNYSKVETRQLLDNFFLIGFPFSDPCSLGRHSFGKEGKEPKYSKTKSASVSSIFIP